MVEGTGFEPV